MRRPSSAFTLLEVLVAMALVSTLMVLLWSLFSTYTRLEERGARTATELQLVRSLSGQMRSDLEHFAALGISPNQLLDPSGSETDAALDSTETVDADDKRGGGDEDQDSISDPASSAGFEEEPIQDNGSNPNPMTLVASLSEGTYLRGSATRLELVTRLPYTVEVPTGQQLLGAETRYGTHQLVVYEWRSARDLASLLSSDPVLNPSMFQPPTPAAPQDPTQPPLPPVPQRLNPNQDVGLVRETKSWLHVARDRRRDEISKRAEAAGLVDARQLPMPEPLQPPTEAPLPREDRPPRLLADDALLPPWNPPAELRHKRDLIGEVTRLQFRYFDGNAWQLEWQDDSALPLAVEIAFDLDPDSPAVRAREFEAAHELMLGGAALVDVLPPEADLDEDFEDQLDPLSTLNMEDPTAIVTEYRFVIALPRGKGSRATQSDSIAGLEAHLQEAK